ncbi:hypothetical protein GCM10022140_47660 [Rhodococcus aetherivorans]
MPALTDTIGTVRVRSAQDNPQSKLAASDAVRRVALRTTGPSSRAILVIRSITDCRLDPQRRAAFSADLQHRVDQCWRSALPPIPAAATANAVVFRDLTELLTHYLVDLADARVGDRWWWAALHGRFAWNDTVAGILSEQMACTPSIFAELRTLGRLAHVVSVLDEPTCAQLTRTLTDVHAAPRFTRALDAVTAPAPVGKPVADCAYRAFVGTLTGIVGPARRLFAACALQLADDPLLARSSAFTHVAVAVAAAPPATEHDSAPVDDVEPRPAATDAGSAKSARHTRDPVPIPARAGPRRRQEPAPEATASPAPEPATNEPAQPRTPTPLATATAARREQFRTGAPRRQAQRPDIRSPSAARNADPIVTATGVITELGGAFFLVEFVRTLRLPERFEDDWQLASRLGWWGTIEILARSLVPRNPARARDPIWTVLTELAGGRPTFERARSIPAHAPTTDPGGLIPQAEMSTEVTWAPVDTTLAGPARHGLRRWLECTRAPLCSLLADRLDCRPDDMFEALIERRARVAHDRTHVDVHYELASATVAVRRAGLDRDPGWVPALGRVITFHFDDDLDGGG